MTKVKLPGEVFTPRNPDVNEAMYIERPALERAFIRAVNGTQHVLIHGESGTGKSWLYKRALHQQGAAMVVANLANASRLGSISKEIESVVAELGKAVHVAYSETKAAEASAFGVAKGSLSHTDNYALPQQDTLERSFRLLRERAGDKTCCLVLDNLETVFQSKKLMSELGEIIVLLDDQRYARHRIKLVIVGVPSGVREYFTRAQNRATVTNRLVELPEVSALDFGQVDRLVRTGFVVELKYKCTEESMIQIVKQVQYVTSGIPQRVHELCLELAYLGEDSRTISDTLLEPAAKAWLQTSLNSVYAAVESMMNERNTVAGRRNQVLFAIGKVQRDEFGYIEIEDLVRQEFPKSTAGRTLNISGLLSDLASRDDALIKRSPKGDRYLFVDPKYRMCLRVMLRKVGDKVDKVEVRQLFDGNA